MSGHATINRLYRLVWSDTLGAWVAVAENTRGRGKRSGRGKLLAALFAGVGAAAMAHGAPPTGIAGPATIAAPAVNQLPTGGKVTGGVVNIAEQGANMTVTQSTQRGALDWNTFNVGSGAQVQFVQPSASAVTLNRVLDTQASQIYGRITANGQVFLSNPNGVYFSSTASVDVGGLVATTHSLDTADFMAGGSTFQRNGALGSVVNDGTLHAGLGGYIALLAPEVRNNGIIIAQSGTVALAAGEAVSLQFDARQSLVGVLVTPAQIDTLVENGNAVRAPGGTIIMSAQAAQQLQDGVVRNTGTLEATGLTTQGGKIVLDSSGLVDNSGTVDASGTRGGGIAIQGDRMVSAGTLRADGGAGSITSTLKAGLVETTSAVISASAGTISVDGGAGAIYTSGSYQADGLQAGQQGGKVTITADSVALMGAKVSATGDAGGGTILIGGDYQGQGTVAHARETKVGLGVTLNADAITSGNGGKIVVWSDQTTVFAGAVSAQGGAASGDGGVLEVSGKENLYFGGTANAHAANGTSGSLLLDPKNIYIDSDLSGQLELRDPHPTSGGTFGATTMQLTTTNGGVQTATGYMVVTNPLDNLGATASGAAYLFRASDQALISTLYGTHANDQVGSYGVTNLTNGNFLVASNKWNGGRGALTFGNGSTGWGVGAYAVSASNSLVGSTATHLSTQGYDTSDNIGGNTVTLLSNGNYLVGSTTWSDYRGALTFGNGATGTSGVVSASNSLVGSTAMSNGVGEYSSYKYGDQVGSNITVLSNDNYVLANGNWNKGVGAVTFGTGTAALTGVLGAANSLVGDSSRSDATGNGNGTDKVGRSIQFLSGTSFIVYNSDWKNGAGMVTTFDGVNAITGLVSASNSLVGNTGDYLTSGGVTVLGNNAYVISSPSWNGGRGAVTLVAPGTNAKNVAVATAGIVGATAGDGIGSRVTVLGNNDYVVSSPNFNAARGASTLVDGTTGKTKVGQSGTVTAANSLVGSTINDQVGSGGIVALSSNGNYVTLSPYWNNGSATKAGAVTFNSGTSPTVGAVSSTNSLVGSTSNDRIGSYQSYYYQYNDTTAYLQEGTSVTALSNGNYVVASPMFNGTRGAVTWVSGTTGATVGGNTITTANSLVGSSAGQFIGGFVAPADVVTNTTNNTTSHQDTVGNGVLALANGNFVTASTYFNNGSATHAGAVTWSDGAGTPTVGTISSANSLVGSKANDRVGTGKYGQFGVTALLAGYDVKGNQLYSGNYVVSSFAWDNGSIVDAGAVTWGSGTAALTGTISNVNSVVGTQTMDANGWTVVPLAVSGNYLIQNPYWNNGAATEAGALTFVNGATGRVADYAAQGNRNIVSATSSLVGSHAGDHVGAYIEQLYTYDPASKTPVYTGNYVALSTSWANGANTNAGAVTWGSGTIGVAGTISTANSLVGVKTGDYLGSYYAILSNGNYVIGNPTLDVNGVVNAGGASWVDGTTGRLNDYAARGNQNLMSAANALVGSHTDDKVGGGVVQSMWYSLNYSYADSGYFIISDQWNCTAGALTYIDAAHSNGFISGVVGASNSGVGNPNGNLFGGLTTYPYMSVGPTFNGNALVTFTGDNGHVVLVSNTMPAAPSMVLPGVTQFGDAQAATQAMTPDYIAGVLRTGTNLTLQANNDIFVKSGIDATGGTAGGSLTMRAGRSIAVLGDIVTGNRDLTLVANDTVANGVKNAYRDDGVATISMGATPQGTTARIDAGTGNVSITLAAGADKTYSKAGSISLNNVSGNTITVVNQGNGAGVDADLPAFDANCCGFNLGTRTAAADIILNTGAVLHGTGAGTAVTLAANGNFNNLSGTGSGSIVTGAGARWLVYANAPGTSTFGNLDSGNTAVWNATYTGAPVNQAGNRYLFRYQPTVTVGTQNVTKTYGDDLATGSALADRVLSISGAQTGVAGAYLGDTLATAISGAAAVTSAGAAANAGASGTPYGITVNLAGVTGQNGYLVTLGSNTARTLTVNKKALSASLAAIGKTYDGTTAAVLGASNYVLSGLVNGETFNVGKTSGAFNLAGVGASTVSTTLAAGDFTGVNGALAANYILPVAASGAGTIAPKALTATVTASKTYDGTNSAMLAGSYVLGGFVAGQSATVNHAAGVFNSADVASATTVAATLAAGDFSAGSGTSFANYILPTTASGAGTIYAKALTLSLTGQLGKVYDGTTAAVLAGANFNLGGFVGSESAAVTKTAGVYNSASTTATSVGVTLNAGDYQAGSGTTLSNYTLPTTASRSATISRAALTVTANNDAKLYDGVAYSGGNGVAFSGLVAGETAANLGGALTYGGTAQGALNVGNYSIAASGYTSSNYTISYVNGQLAISPRQLVAVTANLVGSIGKEYDGSLLASLMSSNFYLNGFVNGDGATVTQTVGTYDSRNAGARTVTATLAANNFTANSGTNLGNYTLPTAASGSGTITPKSVTLTAPTLAKVYDGGLGYTASAGNLASLGANLVGGDTVGSATLSFTNRNVGAGNRAVDLAAVTVNDGNNGANYSVTLAGNTNSTISPRVLHVSATGVDRVYDAGTGASVVLGDDRIDGDALSLANTGAQFADKNAGANKAINVTGISVNGADSGNYMLTSTTAAATANIARAQLAVSGVTAVARAYDTGTTVALSGPAMVASLGNDVVAVSGTGVGQLADKNAGQGKAVTVSGYSITDTNYVLVQPTGLTVTINPAVLGLNGLTVVAGKTYDGTRTATLAGTATVNGLNGEAVSVLGSASALYADANAGYGKTVTVSGLASSDTNYVINPQPALFGDIARAQLGVSINGVGKVYDGSTAATLGSGNYALSGLVGSESIVVNQASGLFDSKNAGVRSVSVGLAGANFAGLNGTLLSNYSLPTSASGSAVITPKSVVLGAPSVSKVYDGTLAYSTTATDLATMDAALVAGDHVSAANLSFASKNAGNQTINLNTATVDDGNNGANYVVTLAGNTTGTITPRVLTVSATGVGRVYDAGTGAAVLLADDRVAGDTLALANANAQFADKNAGVNKAINVTGISVNGADSGNYLLANITATASATIAQAQLAVSGVTAVTRAYDSGTTVAMAGTPTVTPLGNDVVTVTGGTGQLADKNVGQGKSVTVSGYSITDTNYVLVQPTGLTVDINPAVLALGGLNVVAGKTYDGTRTATLAGNAVVNGFNGEAVNVLGSGSALFADANAGSGKAVTVSGLASSDSNYVIGQQAGLVGTIAQARLGVHIDGVSKVYDGSTAATLGSGNYNLTGLVGSESIVVSQNGGLFDSKNAGVRSVSADLAGANFAGVNGTLLSNYSLPTSASGSAVITPKSVVLGAPSVSKVYDGTLVYSTTTADLVAMDAALVAGDHVSAANLSFGSKNAGNQTVNLNTAMVDDGNNGANYVVTLAGNTAGTITQRTLQVSATGVNRTYDAGTGASVVLADDRIAGDTLAVDQLAAAFTDKNAGTGKEIVVSGLRLAGADSANYLLASNSVSARADIARADLTVGGVATAARAYDAGTGVSLFGTPTVNALGSDVVRVSGTGVGTLADKNAALGKQVAVSGYTISDSNYRLIQPTGLTVDIAPAVLALNGLTTASATKTYDGTRSVALTGTASVSGVAGETVTLSGTAIGQFADKNVGNAKAITISGLAPLDSNYVVGQQAGLSGSIVPATLAVSGVTANDKLFDGTVAATLSGTASVAPVAGDAVSVGGVPTATFASADAGIAKAITVSGFALAGTDAGNYNLQQPAGLTATIDADAALVPPPVVVATQALPTPPLTVQLSAQLSTTAPTTALVAPATTPAGIIVSLVRESARQESGMVTVSVPKAIAQGTTGFSFPLPAQLVEAAAINREQVTASTVAGGALPAWLRYDNASKSFTATAAPDGSLPFQVLLTIGIEQVVVVITQSGE